MKPAAAAAPEPESVGQDYHANSLMVVLIYAAFAGLWILLSDQAVAWLFSDPSQHLLASTLKGLLFVAVTSLLLYGLLRRVCANGGGKAQFSGKALGWPFLAMTLIVATLTAAAIHYTMDQHEAHKLARLQVIAELKAQQIDDWLQERGRDAEFVQADALYAQHYRQWHERGDAASGKLLRARLEALAQHHGFSGVTLLDGAGRRLWGSAGAPAELAPPLHAAAARALAAGRTSRVGPYLGRKGRQRLDFLAPLASADGPVGLAVLHTDPTRWFGATLQTWPVPSASGETELFRREGAQVLYLNALRHRKDTALKLRLPLAQRELLAARVLNGAIRPGEVVRGRDYRAVATVGVARAVPGTDWFLVAKQDQAELRGEGLADAAWMGMAGLLVLIALGTGLVSLRQREQLGLAEATRQAQDERLRALKLLAAIADSSDDAIFAMDLSGRYILFNRAAERASGQAAQDILGCDESALFSAEVAAALQADNRWVIEHGISKTVEESLLLGADMRTLLTNKSPLRDPNGKVIGLLGIARDITERKQAEEALRESEGRFRALVEQSLAGIYIIQAGRFRYVNPGFAGIFGYDTPEQIVDRLPVAELVAPEDRERVAENIRSRLVGDFSDIHYTFTGLRQDGSRINVEVHGRAFNYQGSTAVIGLILDITSRKAAEDALRASELRFHDIVNASADWVWEIDAAARYTYVSESVRDLLGYTPAEILGKTPFDLMPPEEAARLQVKFADIVARRAPFRDLDNVNLHKDGSLRYVSSNGMPILDAAGNLRGYRGLDHDVSERRLAQLALLETSDRLRTLVDTIPDLVWLKDPDGVYLACNRRVETLFGASEAEIVGKTDHDFVPPDLADFFRAKDLAAIAANGPCVNEEEVTFASDGHQELLHTIKTPIHDSSGRIIGVLGIARDITERKQAEAAVRRLADDLAATLQAIPDLLFELDESGRYLKVEASKHNLLAAPADRLLGHTVQEMLPADAAGTVMEALASAARNGSDYGRTITLPLATGPHHFELSVARKTMEAGATRQFIVLSRDITARKAAEDELIRNNLELQRFNRATVGRELDMIELKRQVNALSQELGRQAPFSLSFLDEREP